MSAEFFSYSDFGAFDFSDPFMMIFMVVYGVILLISFAYAVTVYIVQSLGMYTIAKRRGIHHPGLAWVPVANMWILGSVSDQYQYVVKGRIRNRRKVLLGLMIAVYVLLIVFAVVLLVGILGGDVEASDPARFSMIVAVSGSLVFYLIAWVLSMIAMVFMYIAYYDLFMSCNPGNAVLFLVLGIFFNFLLPFFVFVCRKKDEGMPPRRVQVPVEPWVEDPAEPEPVE